MLFNSFQFLVFFPVVTAVYFLLPQGRRNLFLLLASCLFYMAFIPKYLLILIFTIIVDYFAGVFIENAAGKRRRLFLAMSIVANVSVLAVFKYYNFLNSNFEALASFLGLNYPVPVLDIILPIGLSFHTFQAMSYTIEVYRGSQKAERNFFLFALYVMFYPQLVAGPIERPQNLLHQFYEEHKFDYQRAADALKLMAWGMFKKVVIADRLAIAVNHVYGAPAGQPGLTLLLATVFFAFQIYCDFSGYADIAIGSAQMMGFRLMDNFNRPYFSKSIAEFWKRWHISLSTWFRDYVYISLGGNRTGWWRWQFNLFFTFLLSGLWHGANWTYVIWGGINGFYLVFSLWTRGLRDKLAEASGLADFPRLRNYLQVLMVFGLTCFAWIFFRARNLPEALLIIKSLGRVPGEVFSPALLRQSVAGLGMSFYDLAIGAAAVLFMEGVHLVQRHGSIRHMLREKPAALRWGLYYALVMSIILLGKYGPEAQQFIYFQF